MINQATSILATGSTEAYEKQQRVLTPENVRTVRQEGDYDLIAAARNVLATEGVDITNYDGSRIIQEATNLRPEAQRYCLNRFFRNQMMSVTTADSIEARTNLVEDGEFEDWLRLFQSGVVPFLKEHSLPKNIF